MREPIGHFQSERCRNFLERSVFFRQLLCPAETCDGPEHVLLNFTMCKFDQFCTRMVVESSKRLGKNGRLQ